MTGALGGSLAKLRSNLKDIIKIQVEFYSRRFTNADK